MNLNYLLGRFFDPLINHISTSGEQTQEETRERKQKESSFLFLSLFQLYWEDYYQKLTPTNTQILWQVLWAFWIYHFTTFSGLHNFKRQVSCSPYCGSLVYDESFFLLLLRFFLFFISLTMMYLGMDFFVLISFWSSLNFLHMEMNIFHKI